jgi:hypothetical protein
VELNKALAMGYRVTRFYAAYHWERWSQDLFRGYVRQMYVYLGRDRQILAYRMKMKIEASGWPEICMIPSTRRIKHASGASLLRNMSDVIKSTWILRGWS